MSNDTLEMKMDISSLCGFAIYMDDDEKILFLNRNLSFLTQFSLFFPAVILLFNLLQFFCDCRLKFNLISCEVAKKLAIIFFSLSVIRRR